MVIQISLSYFSLKNKEFRNISKRKMFIQFERDNRQENSSNS